MYDTNSTYWENMRANTPSGRAKQVKTLIVTSEVDIDSYLAQIKVATKNNDIAELNRLTKELNNL